MPPKRSAKPVDCDLCCKRILDGKEEALHCEGGCRLWFHCYCAGVSTSLFKELCNSPEPFLCYVCYQRSQLAITKELRNEVANLKSEIVKLSEQLASLSTAGSTKERDTVSQPHNNYISSSNQALTYAATLKQDIHAATPSSATLTPAQAASRESRESPKNSTRDKKFNVVMYGLSECTKGSPRHERISYDNNLAYKIIKSICPDISEYAICDCIRIGKYSEPRKRPLIVKFVRSCDVAIVLSNRHKLSNSELPKVSLKPFMSIAEQKTESIDPPQREKSSHR